MNFKMKRYLLKLAGAVLALTLVLMSLVGCSAGNANTPDYSAEEILSAVREAYGDNYLPTEPMDDMFITEVLGISLDNVEDYAGELPMTSIQPDRVLILKAASGKGADVEADVNAALDIIKANAGFYPMNMAKANAAKVLRHGDYVCLLLVGAVDETSETEEDAAKFAEEQVKIAVDAVNALFK